MPRRSRIVERLKALLLLLTLVCVMETARADCPTMPGADAAALTAHDDEVRLAWIQARLARTSHRAKVWRDAWGIGIIGATAVDLAMIPILGDTRSNRIDFGLGAATTIPGIVPLIFWQPRVIEDHAALEAHIANAGSDRCAALAEAEKLLVADAAAEHEQRAWYMHAGNVALNAGITLLFGAFDHWTSGIINGIGGAIVGEAIIYTEPIDQIDDLAQYRRGELGGGATVRHARVWQLVPASIPRGSGLMLSLSF